MKMAWIGGHTNTKNKYNILSSPLRVEGERGRGLHIVYQKGLSSRTAEDAARVEVTFIFFYKKWHAGWSK